MKRRSEFDRILETALSGPNQDEQTRHTHHETQKSTHLDYQSDLLFELMKNISPSLPKQNVNAHKTFKWTARPFHHSAANSKKETPQPTIRLVPAPEPMPIKKEKRNWNEEQKKALTYLFEKGASGLDDYSTNSEIKKEYRRLAKIFHPDYKLGGSPHFRLIHNSYKILVSEK